MIFGFDEFEFDAANLELRRAGRLVKADTLVLRLLTVLVQQSGRLLTKDELVDQVWQGRAVADNVITVSMARLRKVLGHSRGEREFVATVYGRGYRFVRSVSVMDEATPAAPLAPSRPEIGPPFVGRARVLERLRQALREAEAGRGRVCALLGEAGIGKTRVVEALEHELAGLPVRVLWGYCRESSATPPLWPWLRLLREAMGTPSGAAIRERLGPLACEIDTLLGDAQPAPAAAPHPPAGAARHRGFDAILRAFSVLAESAPCVLVLDDLHAADAASLELLGLLVDEVAHTRILVIATLQPDHGRRAPRPETQLPQVLGHRNCERIALERLTCDEVTGYVAALVADENGELGRAVFEKSEGNPFFMVELARQLRDAEDPDPRALQLSDTALESIRKSVARLDADTRDLLSAAAVIGRSFELGLLSAITEREPAALMAGLDQALEAELLVVAPDSVTAFAFGHELLRAVLADRLTPAEQRHWHLRIAQALDQRVQAGDAVAPAEVAYHFHAALPESDLRKTVDYCRRAAAASAAVFANPDVVRYARHALEALDLMPAPSLRLRAALLYQTALYERGHAVEFPRTMRKVIQLARELGDGGLLVAAASMLNPHPGFAPVRGAGEGLRQALDLLPAESKGLRAIALAGLSITAPACHRAEASEALIADALALARESRWPLALQVALEGQLYLHAHPRDAESAAKAETELEQLAREHRRSMPVLPAVIALRRAVAALQRGDVEQQTAAIEEGSMRAREVRHGELSWHFERFAALACVNRGAWSDGLARLEALHRRAEQRPIIGTEAFCAFDRVVVFGELAESAPLDDGVRSALEYDPGDPPSIWALKLRALAKAGLGGEARAALHAFRPSDLAQLPWDMDYLGTLGHVARSALELQALDYAEAVHALLAPHGERFAAHVGFLCEGAVSQLLGMLSHALGLDARAIAELEAGVRLDDRAGLAPRAAEARLQLAERLFERGDAQSRSRGRELAREAQLAAERLGMQRLARAASVCSA